MTSSTAVLALVCIALVAFSLGFVFGEYLGSRERGKEAGRRDERS